MTRPTTVAHRGSAGLWLAGTVAAALLSLAGGRTLLDDPRTDTDSMANPPSDSTTTTRAPEMRVFAVPFSVNGPFDDWTTVDGAAPIVDFDFGPVGRLTQTSIKFAIPDAATPEDALAAIAAKSPSRLVIGDRVDTTVGNMPATCMDVQAKPGADASAPLFQIRHGNTAEYDVELHEHASGRLCVVDVEHRPVIVLVRAPAAELATFLKDAQAVLDAVEFCTRCPTTPLNPGSSAGPE